MTAASQLVLTYRLVAYLGADALPGASAGLHDLNEHCPEPTVVDPPGARFLQHSSEHRDAERNRGLNSHALLRPIRKGRTPVGIDRLPGVVRAKRMRLIVRRHRCSTRNGRVAAASVPRSVTRSARLTGRPALGPVQEIAARGGETAAHKCSAAGTPTRGGSRAHETSVSMRRIDEGAVSSCLKKT